MILIDGLPAVGRGGGGEAGGWENVVKGPGKGILLEGTWAQFGILAISVCKKVIEPHNKGAIGGC